ncbi:MAG: type I restriction-modification system subunit M [Vulcanimicrobiaceae bacterium]
MSQRGQDLGTFIWQVADLLRGDYKPADYGTVVLPFTILRRIDCVLEKTKGDVLKVAAKVRDVDNLKADEEIRLRRASGFEFFNASKFGFGKLVADSKDILSNLEAYIAGFSGNVRDIFERYKFDDQIVRLDEKNLLYEIVKKFGGIDLHPDAISNADMGSAFEYLIRKFNELSNETAGDHYTPRDAIRACVDLLIAGDRDLIGNSAPIRMVYDPTAGTGGMLSIAEDRIKSYEANAKVKAFAQELNDESFAICKADMLIKGQDISNVRQGNTLSDDQFSDTRFDYMLSNPPYGVDWKKVEADVRKEQETKGFKGRFGPGLPRISDGQMLFLLHLVSKMKPVGKGKHGSRIAIIMNGSPLFSGGAGSGESEIRRHVIENDWVEAIVGLPNDMFYNTGIATYIWVLTNGKTPERKGKIQLIDATSFYQKMRKSLGNKRRELSEEDIKRIVAIYDAFEEAEHSKILPNEAFGYRTIVVERPLRLNFQVAPERLARLDDETVRTKNGLNLAKLKQALITIDPAKVFTNRGAFLKALDASLKKAKIELKPPQYKSVWQRLSERDEDADICVNAKGKPEPDPELRDTENVPLIEDVDGYFKREVKPHVADAWIDYDKTKVGYEIPFTRYFYQHVPPRSVREIDLELAALTCDILAMLEQVSV